MKKVHRTELRSIILDLAAKAVSYEVSHSHDFGCTRIQNGDMVAFHPDLDVSTSILVAAKLNLKIEFGLRVVVVSCEENMIFNQQKLSRAPIDCDIKDRQDIEAICQAIVQVAAEIGARKEQK